MTRLPWGWGVFIGAGATTIGHEIGEAISDKPAVRAMAGFATNTLVAVPLLASKSSRGAGVATLVSGLVTLGVSAVVKGALATLRDSNDMIMAEALAAHMMGCQFGDPSFEMLGAPAFEILGN